MCLCCIVQQVLQKYRNKEKWEKRKKGKQNYLYLIVSKKKDGSNGNTLEIKQNRKLEDTKVSKKGV